MKPDAGLLQFIADPPIPAVVYRPPARRAF